MKIYLVGLIAFFMTVSTHAYQLGLDVGARSYVIGASAEFFAKFEHQLWGESRTSDSKPDWKYGLVQLKPAVATYGLAQLQVSIFPVSPVEFYVQQSVTERFYKSSVFDCESNTCKSTMIRKARGLRIAGAYQNWRVLLGYLQQDLVTPNLGKPVVDEIENLLVTAGEDGVQVQSYFVGYKWDDLNTVGLAVRQAQIKNQNGKNELQFLVLSQNFPDYKINYGVGQYQSTSSKADLSLYVNLQWLLGSSLALF